jgi:hypothetical protein
MFTFEAHRNVGFFLFLFHRVTTCVPQAASNSQIKKFVSAVKIGGARCGICRSRRLCANMLLFIKTSVANSRWELLHAVFN